MKIEDRLLKLRKEKGFSQEEVANKLNVSRQTISKWETGQSTPDFDKVIPICELFEITSDELLTGKKKEEVIRQEKDSNNMRVKGIGLSLGLYLLSIILFVLLISLVGPIVALGIFFLGVILATALFIYTCVMYKNRSDMKFLKNLIKKIDSTFILVVLTFINLIYDLLVNTWCWNNEFYQEQIYTIYDIIDNGLVMGFIVISNVLILVLGVRYIINAIKCKKEVLLKVSFVLFSFLTSYFVMGSLIQITFDFFSSYLFN